MSMKVIVAHPGKQHSFQLATALKKAGLLEKYITSVYNKSNSFTRLLLKFTKGDLRKKIESRCCEFLDEDDVLQYNEKKVVFTLFLYRFPSIQKIAEYWNLYVESSFYKKVMKFVRKKRPDAVVVYNGYARKYFEIINDVNVVKIMDMSIAKREYVQKILQKEIDETGVMQIKKAHFSYWNRTMIKNDLQGCKDVDFFLVPSLFVKNSLTENGIPDSKIKIVPYGVNIKQFNPICQKNNSNKLKLIYVGSVTYRKGIHRLLHVVYNMDGVEIFLAGTYDKHSKIYKNYCKYSHIHFVGFVTRDRLNELYNSCDVFVLPSFCEGMAMVGLEAMATGLPIICTRYTGVNDVVRDGINGFVYDANDEKALRVCIEWFLKNKSHLKEMSLNARNSVLDYSWEHYHERVAKTIRECIISKKEDKA